MDALAGPTLTAGGRPERDAGPEPVTPAPSDPATKPGERVQVMVRMSAAERKALRQIALEQDTTAQAIIEDAIRDVLRRHGR